MELEKINAESLKGEQDPELLNLHLRLHQLWGQVAAGARINKELLLNAHTFVRKEMNHRGFSHFSRGGIDDAERELAAKNAEPTPNPWAICRAMQKKEDWPESKYESCVLDMKKKLGIPISTTHEEFDERRGTLPIFSSGVLNDGVGIMLTDILDSYDRPFMVQEAAVSLVGGVAIRGFSQDDADLLVRIPDERELRRRIHFRIGRGAPEKLQEHLQILDDAGPFTDFLPLYDLWMVPRQNPKLFLMSEGFFDLPWTDDEILDFMAAPFSVYGGKRFLAGKIAPLIPPHERYVEPFAGAAAVLFAKEPSREEILTDIDPQKIFGLNFLKTMTEEQRKALMRKDWENSKERFDALRDSKPVNPVDRFYRYMYCQWVSFGAMGKHWAKSCYEPGRAIRYFETKAPRFKERLKNVRIELMDWKDSIKRFDVPGAFFYIDPPYIGTQNKGADFFHEPSAKELFGTIQGIKGKWILSNHDVPELKRMFSRFHVRKVDVPTRVDQVHPEARHVRGELLISNFPTQVQQRSIAATEILMKEVAIPRAASKETAGEARTSAREDRVEPFRFFSMPKPTMGTVPNEPFTIMNFVALFDVQDFPVFSSKKFDGGRHQIHRMGDRVMILSEDGVDHTHRVPKIVEAVRRLRHDSLVIDTEIEMWFGGIHQPREKTNGFLKSQGPGDDSDLVANVFDVLYLDGKDIHGQPIERRLEALESLGISQSTNGVPKTGGLNRVVHMSSKSREELAVQTRILREFPGSEGNVAKKHGTSYDLFGATDDTWIKFRNTAIIRAVVVRKVETKVPGTFNFVLGLPFDPKKFNSRHDLVAESKFGKVTLTGKTFSSEKVKPETGEVVEVEFSPLEHRIDEDGFESASLVLPRVLSKTSERPDTISEAISIAKTGRTYYKMAANRQWDGEEFAEVRRGLVMKEPYGTLIREKKKTAIIKTVKFDIANELFVLVEGDYGLGMIRLSKPETITLDEFKRREPQHLIPAESDFYQGRKELYFYRITEWKPFREPREIKRPQGPQVLISEVKFV